MGKQVRPDESKNKSETSEEKPAVEDIDTDALIESAQGETNTPPPETKSPSSEKKQPAGKTVKLPIEEQPRRSGDACPRQGCNGFLTVMSTHKKEKEGVRIRYLCCNSCKKVGGKEVTPI